MKRILPFLVSGQSLLLISFWSSPLAAPDQVRYRLEIRILEPQRAWCRLSIRFSRPTRQFSCLLWLKREGQLRRLQLLPAGTTREGTRRGPLETWVFRFPTDAQEMHLSYEIEHREGRIPLPQPLGWRPLPWQLFVDLPPGLRLHGDSFPGRVQPASGAPLELPYLPGFLYLPVRAGEGGTWDILASPLRLSEFLLLLGLGAALALLWRHCGRQTT